MTIKAATLGTGGIGKQVVNLSLQYFVHHLLLLSLLNLLYVFFFPLLHTFCHPIFSLINFQFSPPP